MPSGFKQRNRPVLRLPLRLVSGIGNLNLWRHNNVDFSWKLCIYEPIIVQVFPSGIMLKVYIDGVTTQLL